MGDVPDVSGYDGVVLGSAVHNQSWLPEASDFVSRNTVALSGLPVWLFSVGMPDALPKMMRGKAKELQEKRILALLGGEGAGMGDGLRPRRHQVFSGVYREEQLKGTARFLVKSIGGRFGDFRDWPAIEAWADGIAGELAGLPGAVPPS